MPSEILADQLRVAIVLTELRPGGMERVVLHLAKGLAERGVKVLVVCLQAPGQLASKLDDPAIRLVALRSFKGKDFRSVFKLRRVWLEFRPSVINVHDYSSLPYVVSSNALASRVPVLFTAHGLLYQGFAEKRPVYRFFAGFINRLSAVSAKVSERHCEYLDWKRPVEIIANGVPESQCDASVREPMRIELGCKPSDTLFLAVGNPRPEKGFEDLIEAAAFLRNELAAGKGFRIAVAGSLNESDYCRMLMRKLDELQLGSRFKFLGYRDDVACLHRAADAFVLSSRSEGLPMVILEAMMSGLPVVATRIGGIPDAVGGQVQLVEPGNPMQLATAMERLMAEDGLAERLGLGGKEHVKKSYGVDRMVEDYIRSYQSMLLTD